MSKMAHHDRQSALAWHTNWPLQTAPKRSLSLFGKIFKWKLHAAEFRVFVTTLPSVCRFSRGLSMKETLLLCSGRIRDGVRHIWQRYPSIKWVLAGVLGLWILTTASMLMEHPPVWTPYPGDCNQQVYASIASIPGRETWAEAVVAWLLSHPSSDKISGVHLYVPTRLNRKNITTDRAVSSQICARFPGRCHMHFVEDIGSISKLYLPIQDAPVDQNILYLDDDRIHDDVKLSYLLDHGCHYDVLAMSGYINSLNFAKNLLSYFPHWFLFDVDVIRGTAMVYVTRRVELPVPPPGHPCFLMDDEVISGTYKRAGAKLVVNAMMGGGGGSGDFATHGKHALAFAVDRSSYYGPCQEFTGRSSTL
jgi:hypothetical protein